jgi:hypothetical protein
MSLLLIILIVLVVLLFANNNGGGLNLGGGNFNWNDPNTKTWLVVIGVIVLLWLLFRPTTARVDYFRGHMNNGKKWRMPMPMNNNDEYDNGMNGGNCNVPYENDGNGHNGYSMW